MLFKPTGLHDAYIVEPEPIADARGFFARMWCADEFRAHGHDVQFVQANTSYNRHRGTLRGMHFQAPPHEELKLVRCTKGAVYDVIVDLRPDSPTFRRWTGVELSEENRRALCVPEGFAHGYQTLTEDAEVFYLVSAPYAPGAERGVRYDDPAFGIEWPIPVGAVSDKDRAWADFDGATSGGAPPLRARS